MVAGVQVWRVSGDRPNDPIKLHRDNAISQTLDDIARSLQVFAGDLKHAAGAVAYDEEQDALALLRQMSCNV